MVVGYCGVGYCDVGSAPVSYVLVAEMRTPLSYRSVAYGAVWWLEMWRRTHRWGLTRGVAVDRMEVQQRGKRERKPPMDIEIDFFEELGGYYTADLADVLEDFEG